MTDRVEHHGPAGDAWAAITPAVPEAAQTVCLWLITSPGHSPWWSQYLLAVVRLDNLPGWPAPKLHFTGATHEFQLMALNPDYPVQVHDLERPDYQLVWLEPINLAHQFTATDTEMKDLAHHAAWSIVHGHNTPEPPLGYQSFRDGWLSALVKTLAHIRGEEHAP